MVSAGAQIFFASVRAVLEIFCVGAVGVLGARRGWLDRKTCKTLSTFNGNFFLPALLWVSLSRSVSASALRKLWLLPVTCVVHVDGRSGCSGWASCAGRRCSPGFRTVALMASWVRKLARAAGGRREGDHQEPEDWEFDVHER